MKTNQTTATKHIAGANNPRFTMSGENGLTFIRYSCKFAGASRNMPILISFDGINFKMVNGGSDQYNNFIASVIEHNDFSVRFPNIKIIS